MRSFLNEDRLVLFIGTPCQIAGLKTFLRKDYDNLVTVDLICHGVCPTKYLKEEVLYLSNKYGFKDVSDIRFRGNDNKNFYFSLWKKTLSGGSKCVYCKPVYSQFYFSGYLLGVTMRENCYSCLYAKPARLADITIGDFIGLGKLEPFEHSRENVSIVMINSHKGETFYLDLSRLARSLANVERNYNERLLYKPSLVEPFQRHELNEKFVNAYLKIGYIRAIRQVLRFEVYRNELKRTMMYRTVRFFYRKVLKKLFEL